MRELACRAARLTLVAGVLCLASPGAFADPIIVNGSFEAVQIGAPFVSSNPANIPGWTHAGDVGDGLLWAIGYSDGGGSATVAGDGKQFVTLGSGFAQPPAFAAWSQTVSGLTIGDSYTLSFEIAAEGTDSGPQSITVGTTSGSPTPSETFGPVANGANYWRNWVPESYNFTASATSAALQFSVNQSEDIGLDNVSIAPKASAVPEPSTVFLLGSALAVAAAAVRKRLPRGKCGLRGSGQPTSGNRS